MKRGRIVHFVNDPLPGTTVEVAETTTDRLRIFESIRREHDQVQRWRCGCQSELFQRDPHDLRIKCFVNSQLRQNSNTRNLVVNCFDQVPCLSQAMTLEPGDVICTGTPASGVGFASKPPAFLKQVDRVRVELEKIGAIENTVVLESQ